MASDPSEARRAARFSAHEHQALIDAFLGVDSDDLPPGTSDAMTAKVQHEAERLQPLLNAWLQERLTEGTHPLCLITSMGTAVLVIAQGSGVPDDVIANVFKILLSPELSEQAEAHFRAHEAAST